MDKLSVQQTGPPPLPNLVVYPAQWEWLALIPVMIIFMVLFMVMKIVSGVLKPEFIREVRPIAEKAAIARIGGAL